jgi:hypothetical protein
LQHRGCGVKLEENKGMEGNQSIAYIKIPVEFISTFDKIYAYHRAYFIGGETRIDVSP